MSTVSFTGTQVLIGIGLVILIIFSILFYRLISELIRTLRQIRRTVREVERSIQNSQEIIYNVKSITRTVDGQVKELQGVVDVARGTVEQVHALTSAVTKPVSQFRSLLTGLGYAAKYLFKRKPSYDDYEDD
jgi:uncharacterized protein YoxC